MLRGIVTTGLVLAALVAPAKAENALLEETVEFTGAVLFISSGVPGLILGVVQDGETAIAGFGKTRDEEGQEPDGDTVLRIGSISKVFTGLALAHAASNGTVALTDPLSKHLKWNVELPTKEGREIRLIDAATQSSGLPREFDFPPGPANNPYVNHDEAHFVEALKSAELLYAPGGGILYSNVGFDILAATLADATGKSYAVLLEETVTGPIGLQHTGFALPKVSPQLMQGHDWHGKPMVDIESAPGIYGSGALFSTTNDILHWLEWNLDRFNPKHAAWRNLSQASYLWRDGLAPVYGMDESGHMDAMALGWVVMQPEGDRPLILQKAGGMQGVFTYTAFSPHRNIGAFVAINEFDFDTAMKMAEVVNELIATLAPR
ncbi:MAG: D-alanyl-D-alanine-carboxypeptidase/endopeptidase AmpH [Kiloniellales bacterium]